MSWVDRVSFECEIVRTVCSRAGWGSFCIKPTNLSFRRSGPPKVYYKVYAADGHIKFRINFHKQTMNVVDVYDFRRNRTIHLMDPRSLTQLEFWIRDCAWGEPVDRDPPVEPGNGVMYYDLCDDGELRLRTRHRSLNHVDRNVLSKYK
jgi:hypothetical protein